MRILHIAAPARAGGLESVVLDLTSGLVSAGHQVFLAVVLDRAAGDHPVPLRAGELGVEVLRLMVPPKAYHNEYRQILDAIRLVRPEVVHTHGYRADLIGGFAARRAKVPWVATAHGFTGGGRKNRFYEWLQLRSYHRATAIIAVSRPLRDRLSMEGLSVDRIHLFPNAWAPKQLLARGEAKRRLGVESNLPVIGWVGRLTREKGADIFLEALALLPHQKWRASILGDGRERAALLAHAQRLGLADQVRWHGTIVNAASYLSAFDAWVLSSRTEGTPIALLEAMGARVPIVATAVGGVPDVVSLAEAMVVPSECPDALAAALDSILDDPKAAALRVESANRRLVESFGTDKWLRSHLELYESLRIHE